MECPLTRLPGPIPVHVCWLTTYEAHFTTCQRTATWQLEKLCLETIEAKERLAGASGGVWWSDSAITGRGTPDSEALPAEILWL